MAFCEEMARARIDSGRAFKGVRWWRGAGVSLLVDMRYTGYNWVTNNMQRRWVSVNVSQSVRWVNWALGWVSWALGWVSEAVGWVSWALGGVNRGRVQIDEVLIQRLTTRGNYLR